MHLLKHKFRHSITVVLLTASLVLTSLGTAAAVDTTRPYCGDATNGVNTAINFGCNHQSPNPITDLIFAIIRFLSAGVGLVVVGSIIVAGIQYSAARADPQAVASAQQRLRSAITALIIYIFAYAILNYVIPNGFFK